MASPRGSSVNQGKTSGISDLWQLTLDYLEGRPVPSIAQRFEDVTLDDLFRILERLTSLVKHAELHRVQNLLVELAIVRDNTILQDRSSLEVRLLKTIKQSGRLGEFVSLILAKSIQSD
ncbi:MAG: hypothetical protein ACFFCO_05505 [Promethearchaeota archaeon]